MKTFTSLNEAVDHLSKIVNWAESSVKQKRLDFNMVTASEQPSYEAALQYVAQAIKRGEITREEFNRRLEID
jgi:hypothetical protein